MKSIIDRLWYLIFAIFAEFIKGQVNFDLHFKSTLQIIKDSQDERIENCWSKRIQNDLVKTQKIEVKTNCFDIEIISNDFDMNYSFNQVDFSKLELNGQKIFSWTNHHVSEIKSNP